MFLVDFKYKIFNNGRIEGIGAIYATKSKIGFEGSGINSCLG